MDKTEAVKIFDLLQQFYPQAAALKDKKKRYAWRLALEPYAYDDVKAAVLEYSATGKYFPDLADITANLQRIECEPRTEREDSHAWMLPYIEKNKADGLGKVSRYAREHGISWNEAKEAMRKAGLI